MRLQGSRLEIQSRKSGVNYHKMTKVMGGVVMMGKDSFGERFNT